MVTKKTTRHVSSKLILVLFTCSTVLAACGSVLSPQQAQSQIQTSVAQTIEAQNNMSTGVALTLTAMVPPMTATSSPTATLQPSLTPAFTDTPFVFSSGGGGGGAVVPACTGEQLCCNLVDQVPADAPDRNSILKVGDRLDVNFTFQNIGKRVWDPDFTWEYFKSAVDTDQPANVDLTTSSVGFQSTLGATVLKKGYVKLGFEETAPDFEGREPIHMTTRWVIRAEGTVFCTAFSYIEVIRPGMTP